MRMDASLDAYAPPARRVTCAWMLHLVRMFPSAPTLTAKNLHIADEQGKPASKAISTIRLAIRYDVSFQVGGLANDMTAAWPPEFPR